MRRSVLLAALAASSALAACNGGPSKLEFNTSREVDALWDLAPDHVTLGVVASSHAMTMVGHALDAVREAAKQPDLQPAKAQIDGMIAAILGSPDGSPADAGFALDRGFAMFVTDDGVLGVMPVGDRDKYVAAKHGTRGKGDAPDTIQQNQCKPLRGMYVCASNEALFAQLGKKPLGGRAALAGARGDIELFAPKLALLGSEKGDLALSAKLEPGIVALQGRWTGIPDGLFAKLAGVTAPPVDPEGISGYVSFDIGPLLVDPPAVPIGAGVTLADFAKAITGKVRAQIPAGTLDVQIDVPLKDPSVVQTLVDHCSELTVLPLAEKQTPGACRLALQGMIAIELDAWVEGSTLRLAAHKGEPAHRNEVASTPTGEALAAGWTATFWGRGTMLDLGEVSSATAATDAETSAGIHVMALVNELGGAVRVDKYGLTFRGYARTIWANPPEVVAQAIAVTGEDIQHGKGTAIAKAIADAYPESPFGHDAASGQGGLMVPAAAIGVITAFVIPMVLAATQPPRLPRPKPDETQLTEMIIGAYVNDAYPKYIADHPDKLCPTSVEDLAKYLDAPADLPVLVDPWHNRFVLSCNTKDHKGFGISSNGPDGKPGTLDDVKSW